MLCLGHGNNLKFFLFKKSKFDRESFADENSMQLSLNVSRTDATARENMLFFAFYRELKHFPGMLDSIDPRRN
jgi:hypothetical protein